MENLNKEFFNELRTKFPSEMKHFDTWLGKYKSEVKWNLLFFDHTPFCEIPFDMQAGVIWKYLAEINCEKAENNKHYHSVRDIRIGFTAVIKELNNKIYVKA